MSDLSGKTAIIGWGSLIWDLETLADKIDAEFGAGGWALGEGPPLPIEFSRVSRKRPGALTLVIQSLGGDAPCATSYALSNRGEAEDAANDLAQRERAPRRLIGLWSASRGVEAQNQAAGDEIAAWAQRLGLGGAVWTDLPCNFAESKGRPFSVEAAIAHLQALDGQQLAEAVAYIRNAPPQTDTPLRRALARNLWWRALAVSAD